MESIYFGAASFYYINSFTLSHNPKLKIFETGDGYKNGTTNYECAFGRAEALTLIGSIL